MTVSDITSFLGITVSNMQQTAIDAFTKSNSNIVLLSPTGSGKTLAYLLPLSQMIDTSRDDVQAVVIVPGRELANQSLDVLKRMKCGIRGYACHGGRPTMDEHREMRSVQPQVIFATPGRLNDHLDKDNFVSDTVRFIVIDEFDKCLEMGFADEMSRAVSRLPSTARRFFLSATDMTDDERMTAVLSTDGFSTLDFREQGDGDRLEVSIVRSQDKDKLHALASLLKKLTGSTIVFLNYRDSVERTAAFLAGEGFIVSTYHGGLDQRQREEAVYRFANGSTNVLVSTDLGSRGLDIPGVENVVHYHLPETVENYTHRVGRTARWDNTGRIFFLLGPDEVIPDNIREAVFNTKGRVDAEELHIDEDEHIHSVVPLPVNTTLYIGKGKKDKISKGDIVGFLCKSGGLKGNEIGRIDVFDYYAYVAIPRAKLKAVLNKVQGLKIKGHRTKIEEMQ